MRFSRAIVSVLVLATCVVGAASFAQGAKAPKKKHKGAKDPAPQAEATPTTAPTGAAPAPLPDVPGEPLPTVPDGGVPPPRVPAAPSPALDAALDALAKAAPGQPRLDAIDALVKLAPTTEGAMIEKLNRPRTATDVQRRAVLAQIHAEVPLPSGAFAAPPRSSSDTPVKEIDWLAMLAPMPGSDPALTETIEIVALLHALATTEDEAAAQAIFDFAFSEVGITFRDECGRTLRRMSPYSLATLLRASQDKKRAAGAYSRYAAYQLDKLDKPLPAAALKAAPNDEVEIAMLHAIRDTKHPDAVPAVLERCDAQSHAIRHAAREAWMAYVTGPPPPEAPKEFRKLAGGRMSDKKLPKYLTYRELADQEIRRVLAAENGGKEPDVHAGILDMTKGLFEMYDRRRAAMWDDAMAEASKLGETGKWDEAGAKYDAILVADPLYAKRALMAPGFLELGRRFAQAKQWEPAVKALNKALSLDPTGPKAKDAEAELAMARGMLARSSGKSGAADLEMAVAADPGNQAAQQALSAARKGAASARYRWMLWAGLGGGALAALLVALGLLKRR